MIRKFIFRFLLFSTPLLLFFLTGEYVVTQGLRKVKNTLYKEWNELYDGAINADIVIQGSSRAWVHVSPMILDSALKVNSYNLGLDGAGFKLQYCRYKEYLQYNQKPKTIIQTLDVFTLQQRKHLTDHLQFLPYLLQPGIRTQLLPYHSFSNAEYYVPFYRYINYPDKITLGLQNFFSGIPPTSNKYKGYEGKAIPWDGLFEKYKKNHPNGRFIPQSPDYIRLMELFLDESTRQGIQVILVYPPEYVEAHLFTTNRKEVINHFTGFAKKYNLQFLDYSNDTISHDKTLFYNSQHLNKKGAELFSKKLAQDIKFLLQ